MELAHRFIQVPREPGNRLRAHDFTSHGGHHSPHLARADSAQESLPDQQADFLRSPLKFPDDFRQEILLPRSGDAHHQRPKAGDKITLIVPVAIILALLVPAVAGPHHVQVPLPLRQQFEKLLGFLYHLALQIAPEGLLEVG